jgi:cell filamentation protein, protein adenylyltransferase
VDVERFKRSPVGRLDPIQGHDAYLQRDYSHYAFVPCPPPSTLKLSQGTYASVANAHGALGRLDFAVRRLPDPRLLVRPVLRREAQSTSELEGTYAPLDEVLAADFIDEARRSAELREVMNYVLAAERALLMIQKLPICLRVLCRLQAILVKDTRGQMYDSGQLRQRQVFIGERELGIEESRFVPVPEGDLLQEGVSDWEKWINAKDDMPLVVKAAVGHYQFEALHPFSDGNGRLGRLIAILQMIEAGTLAYPVLNLSPWLKPRKEQYKDLLLGISATGDYDPWVRFFSTAVQAQADDMVERIEQLLSVREELLSIVREHKIRGFAVDIIEDLIGYSSITPSAAAKRHKVQYKTANDAVKRLEALGILTEVTGASYGRIFVCPRVRDIVLRP